MARLGLVTSAVLTALAVTGSAAASACRPCKNITVDVVVLGGGAAGSYIAAELVDIHKKSVVVVDHASRLGGHVDTVRVPGVDHPIDFGVVQYHNLSHVYSFFQRFGINLVTGGPPAFTSVLLDQTGAKVNATAYSQDEFNAAVGRWVDFCTKYKAYFYPGFKLPSPLGDAALSARPFGETAKELKLEPLLLTMTDMHWANDLLTLPTLQTAATFGLLWLDGTPLVVPESRNNTELYAKIQAHLGPSVLLDSTVRSVRRDAGGGGKVVVNGPQKSCTAITAKQIVVAFAPTADNMRPFDTTPEEAGLFAKWDCVKLWDGLVDIKGMPSGTDLKPVSSDPARDFIPKAPYTRFINYAPTPYSATYIVGAANWTSADAKREVNDRLNAIAKAGGYDVKPDPEYWGFADHTPIMCSVGQQEIADGFWSRVNGLQGKRDMWYIGQTVTADLTASVWAQTQEVLEQLLKKI